MVYLFKEQVKSGQFELYSPKSQSYFCSGFDNMYSEQLCLS